MGSSHVDSSPASGHQLITHPLSALRGSAAEVEVVAASATLPVAVDASAGDEQLALRAGRAVVRPGEGTARVSEGVARGEDVGAAGRAEAGRVDSASEAASFVMGALVVLLLVVSIVLARGMVARQEVRGAMRGAMRGTSYEERLAERERLNRA